MQFLEKVGGCTKMTEFTEVYLLHEIHQFREMMGQKKFWQTSELNSKDNPMPGSLADPTLMPIERAKNALAFTWLYTNNLSDKVDSFFQATLREYNIREANILAMGLNK
jgi:hypothetical protein